MAIDEGPVRGVRALVNRPRQGLFVASVLALFAELVLIRWLPSAIHAVAFFANLVLIASFLGLGIGMANRIDVPTASWRALWRLALASGFAAALGILKPVIDFGSDTDYALNETGVGFAIPSFVLLVGVYAMAVWVMIPFGQLVAAFFDDVPRLPAYSINIGGSLVGVLAFAAVAALRMPPVVWFAVLVVLLLLLDRQIAHLGPILLIGVSLAALFLDASSNRRDQVLWSPYYKVVASPISESGELSDGFVVNVNNQFLLSGLDLSPGYVPGPDIPDDIAAQVEQLKSYYSFPFSLSDVQSALVLGSGAGNDVAAALRAGVGSVTAVEIDPLVLELGTLHHPEQPYGWPSVKTVVDDGRAFLRESDDEFDLVLFATLDAHGLLSGTSNLRIDSFIYTKESIQSAKDHVAPGGLLVLSFGPFREDVQYRQYTTVRDVFGQEPLFFLHETGQRSIVAGDIQQVDSSSLLPGWRLIDETEIEDRLAIYPYAETAATDDWPYLYIREPRIPREYIWTLIGIIVLSLILVTANFRQAYRVDGHFLFLGAGFLLLETKSVTEFGLLMGSTWQTNVMVFSVILVVILGANLLVMTRLPRPPIRIVYGVIGASLLLQYAFPVSTWATQPGAVGLSAAALYLGVPIFLAAIVFAGSFQTAAVGTAALASNLVGAVLGGTTEYLSLAWGIRSLTLIALGMYALSWVFWERRRIRSFPVSGERDFAARH